MADSAPTRDPATRAALRASVLVMMLISVSAQASAREMGRGFCDASHSARIALQARLIVGRLLPAETEAGLCTGIRFEMPREPATQLNLQQCLMQACCGSAPTVRTLRAALLNLPPPAL